ncbi:MAG TPA: D-alanyl-D-alanine carboxypeptidase [Firmicutes bacterium]|jgi:D-alanyl-D-alanine carboxypeptidase (penicillin-binding protein 5/6)|nr:D-alanyl-D-alanine carboxypeptidase [Bacillota bacterium]
MGVFRFSGRTRRFLLFFFLSLALVAAGTSKNRKEIPAGSGYRRVEGYPPLIYLPDYTGGPAVYARAAILVEEVSGMILYAKNEHQRRAPASTTKILTAIVALEKGNLEDVVTVSRRAARTGGSALWLKTGDRLTLKELLEGLMLCSGNDAGVAVAEHIAGSERNFARMMNRKAKELGALNSNFQNPHGLRAPAHYTTAYDLARLTCYALRNPEFSRLVSAREEAIQWYQGEKTRKVRNTNRLLWSFAGADGVKTGTTAEAGYCLVASATRDGRRFISVVLNSPDRWGESARLLEYGFDNFTLKLLATPEEAVGKIETAGGYPRVVAVYPRRPLMVVIPKGEEAYGEKKISLRRDKLRLPVKPGTVAGEVAFFFRGEKVCGVDLIVRERVDKDWWWRRLWSGRE